MPVCFQYNTFLQCTCEIRFKPVERRSGDGRQENLMIHSAKRIRTDDLESAFAICKATASDSKAVSVEWPLLKPETCF